MELKLSRRRFGQLAIASTATGAIGYLANKTFAQMPNLPDLTLYGARSISAIGQALIQTLNVTSPSIGNLTNFGLQPGEKLSGFTFLADGTLVLSFSAVLLGKKKDIDTRLVFIGVSGVSLKPSLSLSGLKKEETIDSLLGLKNGSLIALVLKKNGKPPVKVVEIDTNSGQISLLDKIKLPKTDRFSNLAQCPDGTIYTTAVDRKGETTLVQLDLGQGKPSPVAQLNLDNTIWNSGLNSLVCSSGGELFALAAPRYVTPKNVYKINPSNGAMTLRAEKWNVSKITTLQV
jgi:hypothetical protein